MFLFFSPTVLRSGYIYNFLRVGGSSTLMCTRTCNTCRCNNRKGFETLPSALSSYHYPSLIFWKFYHCQNFILKRKQYQASNMAFHTTKNVVHANDPWLKHVLGHLGNFTSLSRDFWHLAWFLQLILLVDKFCKHIC